MAELRGGGTHRNSSADLYRRIISRENLLTAWKEFKRGKTKKPDVQEFEFALEENIFAIHATLQNKTYCPDPYVSFFVSDPKRRHIHKATVRDRVVHQAVFRILYSVFNKTFIHDSYSCRLGKGTHRGVKQLARYLNKVSDNRHRTAYALACDVRKFFDSIDHAILLELLEKRVYDPDTRWLVRTIVASYEILPGKGLPLGNVTSQLFSNVYMDMFDQWAKHVLKAHYYLRYCDDFIILHTDAAYLQSTIPYTQKALFEKLKLSLHPNKVSIRKISQGVDFLGYVVLPHTTVLRTRTKNRMFRTIKEKRKSVQQGTLTEKSFNHSLQSYLGLLSHANAYKLRQKIVPE